MLSTALGASAPLSPSAQATLNKHLPKLSAKRLIQPPLNIKPPVQTVEVACLTGNVWKKFRRHAEQKKKKK